MDPNTKKNDHMEENEPGDTTPASGEIIKNPDPRANENLTEEQENNSTSKGAGSEITDGEAG